MAITTGVHGGQWRASVAAWGAIEPWDGSPALDWFVAADDRWHVPSQEPSVRQRRVAGTPVVETRLRVPRGDVVHTVYSCADGGGLTVIEILNESTLPVAIAFDRRDVLTERPIAEVPIEGITLPPDAFVLPVGHRARARVAIAHESRRSGTLPASLPSAEQVVRGWSGLVDRASRLVLPEGESGAGVVERVTAQRCEVALGVVPDLDGDPAGFLLAVHELVRLGEPAGPWVEDVAAAVERVGPDPSWDAGAALASAAGVLAAAGEGRAVADVERIIGRRDPVSRPSAAPDGVRLVAWLESSLVAGGALLPDGIPREWLGQSFEAHGLPTGPGSTVSFAVRWHGARPAVLWEQQGSPVELSAPVVAPGWTSSAVSGETLWPSP